MWLHHCKVVTASALGMVEKKHFPVQNMEMSIFKAFDSLVLHVMLHI